MTLPAFSIRCTAAILALLVAAGCDSGGARSEPPAYEVTDSAGVTIVVSRQPQSPDTVYATLSETPVFAVGGHGDGGTVVHFSVIRSVLRLSNGGVVVGEMLPALRFFDSTGALVRTVGTEGIGPGEFTRVDALHRIRGDTLVVSGAGMQLSWFTGDGDFIERLRPRDAGVPPRAVALDGRLVTRRSGMRTGGGGEASDAIRRDSTDLYVADRHGDNAMAITRELVLLTTPAGPLLFAPRTHHAAREHIYSAVGDEYRVSVFDRSGALVMSIRRPVAPQVVNESALIRAKGSYRSELEAAGAPDFALQRVEQMISLQTHPVISGLAVDGSENVWVRAYRIEEDGVERGRPAAFAGGADQIWSVFGSDGRWLGNVRLPGQLEVTDVGSDYVAGVWRDSDHVESARVYRLNRKGR